jgi:hypothetical protein
MPSVDAMKHLATIGKRSLDPPRRFLWHFGNMEYGDFVGRCKRSAQLPAMQLRALSRKRGELMIDLLNAHSVGLTPPTKDLSSNYRTVQKISIRTLKDAITMNR